MEDMLQEFLTETNESVAVLDVELVTLEQGPEDPDLLGSNLHLAHTIKGSCGSLGLSRLENLTHSAENVFGKLRESELKVNEEIITLILQSMGRIGSSSPMIRLWSAAPSRRTPTSRSSTRSRMASSPSRPCST